MARNIDIYINIKTTQFNKGIKKANEGLNSLNRTVGRIMRTMTAFVALFISRALLRGIGESVRKFAEFKDGLSKIGIMLNKQRGEVKAFSETIQLLAVNYGVATQDLVKAGFDIQSATNNASKSMQILASATRLAVAGGSDAASTTSGLITLMESYGDSLAGAADAADLLLLAQEKARATIGELSGSVSRFLPVAAQMEVKVEELFAVYAQLTRALGNTREASTALGMFLNKLLNPTTKMIDLAEKEWGVSIQRALATKGLIEVLRVLSRVQIEDLGKLISRQRAI